MSEEKQQPRVGLGALILKDGKVLLGRRKGSFAQGEYAFPGGHLEYMERFEDGMLREITEECGLTVKNMRFQMVTNIMRYAPKHFVGLVFVADWESGEPQNLEPEKCEGWDWYDLEALPSPLFASTETAIASLKNG